jgi:16S rRNA G966 N2-methylase RsmD
MNIKINEEYAKLVHPLSVEEYNSLRNSIEKSRGNLVPIILSQENYILDGHHRFKICQELNINPKIEIKTCASKLEEKIFVYEINLKRRHLNPFQKSELAYGLEEIYKETARLRQLSGLKNVNLSLGQNCPNDEKGRTAEIVSKEAGLKPTIYKYAKKIIEEGPESVKEKLRSGYSSVSKEYTKIQVEQRREEKRNEKSIVDLPDNCRLLQGDFMEVGKEIPDNSIDLILTDPPYGPEYLPLYDKLGVFARRVLKKGGSLVAYLGSTNIQEKINFIAKGDLKCCWYIYVKHTGQRAQVRQMGSLISVAGKPMWWFVNGEKTNIPVRITDYVESEPPDKTMHEWAQSTKEAEHIINGLTVDNQIVLDPFLGYGTFGMAALQLNRKFIGIEIDPEHFSNAQRRLSSITVTVKK